MFLPNRKKAPTNTEKMHRIEIHSADEARQCGRMNLGYGILILKCSLLNTECEQCSVVESPFQLLLMQETFTDLRFLFPLSVCTLQREVHLVPRGTAR